jgi:hypothetical protein
MESRIAELREAVVKLRTGDDGRVEADFVLTLRTPLGIEHWDFGWNLQDVDIAGSGGTLREVRRLDAIAVR